VRKKMTWQCLQIMGDGVSVAVFRAATPIFGKFSSPLAWHRLSAPGFGNTRLTDRVRQRQPGHEYYSHAMPTIECVPVSDLLPHTPSPSRFR
jgi:hypothetical protein